MEAAGCLYYFPMYNLRARRPLRDSALHLRRRVPAALCWCPIVVWILSLFSLLLYSLTELSIKPELYFKLNPEARLALHPAVCSPQCSAQWLEGRHSGAVAATPYQHR